MNVIHKTPLLHGDGDKGKKQWQGFVAVQADGTTVYYAEFGSVGGTIQQSAFTTILGKNVGRANETTPAAQAIAEIDAKCVLKQKKGYDPFGQAVAPAIKRVQERIKPMLAPSKVYPALASSLRWPLYIQPKFDGMRLVTNGQDFWSRQGNLQEPANIAHLRHDTKGLLIDGEVIVPNASFQQTMEARADSSGRTVFCVFDIVDLKLTFEERFEVLKQFMAENPQKSWVLTATLEIQDDSEAQAFYEKAIELGMEGAILRNKHGKYRPDYRSPDMQKMKAVDDDEFEIVGYEECDGAWAGTPVFHLKVSKDNKPGYDGKRGKPGTVFKAKPAMSIPEAKKLWAIRDAVIGKPGTVEFQGYYDQKPGDPKAGKPRCPRFKAVRDYE